MANQLYAAEFYDKAARAEVSATLISKKANVCPFAIRLAWHTSGTYDTESNTGGSNGATMRFEPEINDGANAGLALMQDIIGPVRDKFPDLSIADLWTMAGTQAVKLTGGPDVPFRYGRIDADDNSACPPVGRLPDASQGAQHLRDIFYRMGFGDKEIVALSGAHTLGSCHRLRSGYDGPWTHNPLKFDNEFFLNLLNLEWKPRQWDGPLQYADPSGKLMMLPTDMALIQDEQFLSYVKAYAADEELFRKDFAEAYGALLAKGCPAHVQPSAPPPSITITPSTEKDIRDLCMHGALERIQEIVASVTAATAGSASAAADDKTKPSLAFDINAKEDYSARTALHKAAFFGHGHVVEYLLTALHADPNVMDADGDTPLHDAARFGHVRVVRALLENGADKTIRNNDGKTAAEIAKLVVTELLA